MMNKLRLNDNPFLPVPKTLYTIPWIKYIQSEYTKVIWGIRYYTGQNQQEVGMRTYTISPHCFDLVLGCKEKCCPAIFIFILGRLKKDKDYVRFDMSQMLLEISSYKSSALYKGVAELQSLNIIHRAVVSPRAKWVKFFINPPLTFRGSVVTFFQKFNITSTWAVRHNIY